MPLSSTPEWRNAYSDKPVFFHKTDQDYGYFCQWYLVKMVDENGMEFNCCEQYMMYHKAKTFDDQGTMAAVMKTKSPREHKALGKQVKGFTDEVWDTVKYQVVVNANMIKFRNCDVAPWDNFIYPDGPPRRDHVVSLKEALLATGDRILAEASHHDHIWGIGRNKHWAKITPMNRWGQNLLGKALMEVRQMLRDEAVREE